MQTPSLETYNLLGIQARQLIANDEEFSNNQNAFLRTFGWRYGNIIREAQIHLTPNDAITYK